MHEYRTNFNLTDEVKSMSEAQEYLDDDDMTYYLLGDFPQLAQNRVKIRWVLTHPNKGYVSLKSETPINQKMLDEISRWVSGQNSDGLGEGFEQQDFANYDPNEPLLEYDSMDYDDDEGEFVRCEFDWRKNEYKFEEINL